MEPDYEPDAYTDWLIMHDEPPLEQDWLPPGEWVTALPPGPDLLSEADFPADAASTAGQVPPAGAVPPEARHRFAQGAAGDTMAPGPGLCELARAAADQPGRLTDDELLGGIAGAARITAHADWIALRQVAAFARRQEARLAESEGRGDPALRRRGEFGAEELAFVLGITPQATSSRIDQARNLDERLPCTFAALRDGLISPTKAWHIHRFTAPLSDQDAAEADKILGEAAPGLGENGTYAKARRVCYMLDPEVFDRMRRDAARHDQRVEVRQEESGNAQVAMREMPAEDAMALNAALDSEARRLKKAGLDAPLRRIRYWVSRDRALGLNPWDRLASPGGTDDEATDHADGETSRREPFIPDNGYRDGDGYRDDDEYGNPYDEAARGNEPVPGLVNILVPAGTLAGLSDTPGEAGAFRFLGGDQVRAMTEAASAHPATRWCITEIADNGHAVTHGCAQGRHAWKPPPGASEHERREHLQAFLRSLGVHAETIAADTCDHQHKTDRYRPSRALAHLIRARTTTCPAPGCEAQALYNEIDHTDPWPHGDTCECNLSPPCARHHHAKHAPGWRLEQPQPGVMRWTTPSGRTYTTGPTSYDL